jgi:lipopolysaccharide transport system permease protein
MQAETDQKVWKEVILPENRLLFINFKELWEYRDLLTILVRRDILAIYKQTILGPLWFFLQPVLTSLVYILVFSRAAGISSDGIPPVLFYLSGLVIWGYFSECVLRTSSFLKENTSILSKVYFPRLILPLSIIITNLVKFSIQLLLFFIVYLYFILFTGFNIQLNGHVILLPVLIVITGLLGMGAGLIVASLTTKYKDLMHMVNFGVQLLMFSSSVIFPVSFFDHTGYGTVLRLNPVTGIIEAFRYSILGNGSFDWYLLGYDALFMLVTLIAGFMAFNSVQRSFTDTI